MRNLVPLVTAVAIALPVAGCAGSSLDCANADVGETIAHLFRRQLMLTPYLRFIELDKAKLDLEAIFTTASDATSSTCVAFVKYEVKLNDEGQKAKGRDRLLYSLLYELGNEKQVYYRVRRAPDGRAEVHVDRVGG